MITLSLRLILLLFAFVVMAIAAFVPAAGPVRLAPAAAALALAGLLFG